MTRRVGRIYVRGRRGYTANTGASAVIDDERYVGMWGRSQYLVNRISKQVTASVVEWKGIRKRKRSR